MIQFLTMVACVTYFSTLVFFLGLGYEESNFKFSGYQVKHVIFWTYPIGRLLYKIFNIKLTNRK